MKTDKQVYVLFSACPQWIFELAELRSPGECELKAVSLKALDQASDAVIFPKDPDEPLTVVEFQFQDDKTIYARVAIEMALLQQEHDMRPVQGIIFFRSEKLDPKSKPWREIITSRTFGNMLEKLAEREPDHVLMAVFQPLFLASEETLEKNAAQYYNQIKKSGHPESVVSTLLDVFVNWLEQRLKHRGKEEIEKMLIGELPDLRETQSGKDLIRIGKEEGKIEGEREALIWALEGKFGAMDAQTRQRVEQVTSVDKLKDMLLQLLKVDSIDQLKW